MDPFALPLQLSDAFLGICRVIGRTLISRHLNPTVGCWMYLIVCFLRIAVQDVARVRVALDEPRPGARRCLFMSLHPQSQPRCNGAGIVKCGLLIRYGPLSTAKSQAKLYSRLLYRLIVPCLQCDLTTSTRWQAYIRHACPEETNICDEFESAQSADMTSLNQRLTTENGVGSNKLRRLSS